MKTDDYLQLHLMSYHTDNLTNEKQYELENLKLLGGPDAAGRGWQR